MSPLTVKNSMRYVHMHMHIHITAAHFEILTINRLVGLQ